MAGVTIACEGGLANRLRAIADLVYARSTARAASRKEASTSPSAAGNMHIITVVWEANRFCPGWFTDAFEPPPASSGVQLVQVASAEAWLAHNRRSGSGGGGGGGGGGGSGGERVLRACTERQPLVGATANRLYRTLFRPNAALRKAIERYEALTWRRPLRPCVAVHLRATDLAETYTSWGRLAHQTRPQPRHTTAASRGGVSVGARAGVGAAATAAGLIQARNFSDDLVETAIGRVDAARRSEHPPDCVFVATDSAAARERFARAAAARRLAVAPPPGALGPPPRRFSGSSGSGGGSTKSRKGFIRSASAPVAAPPVDVAPDPALGRVSGIEGAALDLLLLARCSWCATSLLGHGWAAPPAPSHAHARSMPTIVTHIGIPRHSHTPHAH